MAAPVAFGPLTLKETIAEKKAANPAFNAYLDANADKINTLVKDVQAAVLAISLGQSDFCKAAFSHSLLLRVTPQSGEGFDLVLPPSIPEGPKMSAAELEHERKRISRAVKREIQIMALMTPAELTPALGSSSFRFFFVPVQETENTKNFKIIFATT